MRSKRTYERGASYLRKFGKLSIPENLDMALLYIRTDAPGRGKKKRIPPLFPGEFCPLLFQKALEIIDN